MSYDILASEESLSKTSDALSAKNITVYVVENGATAKTKALEIIPVRAEVMNMSSTTIMTIGLDKELNESGRYNSVRTQFTKMNHETQASEMQKLGAAPDWTVGSVHAVTEDGIILVASQSGSQLPSYAFGSQHVLWIVGTQKITKDLNDAAKRLYEYVLPLESERAHKAYGVEGSSVNKLLTIFKESKPGRITIIFVKEKLGF